MAGASEVETAVRFLSHPDASGAPIRSRVAYLLDRGVSSEAVQQAMRRMGLGGGESFVSGVDGPSFGRAGGLLPHSAPRGRTERRAATPEMPTPGSAESGLVSWVRWVGDEASAGAAAVVVGIAIGWAARRWIRDAQDADGAATEHPVGIPGASAPPWSTPAPRSARPGLSGSPACSPLAAAARGGRAGSRPADAMAEPWNAMASFAPSLSPALPVRSALDPDAMARPSDGWPKAGADPAAAAASGASVALLLAAVQSLQREAAEQRRSIERLTAAVSPARDAAARSCPEEEGEDKGGDEEEDDDDAAVARAAVAALAGGAASRDSALVVAAEGAAAGGGTVCGVPLALLGAGMALSGRVASGAGGEAVALARRRVARRGLLQPVATAVGLGPEWWSGGGEEEEAAEGEEEEKEGGGDGGRPAASARSRALAAVSSGSALWQMLGMLVRNLRKQPDVPRYRRLPLRASGFQSALAASPGHEAALLACGFAPPSTPAPWRQAGPLAPRAATDHKAWEWVLADDLHSDGGAVLEASGRLLAGTGEAGGRAGRAGRPCLLAAEAATRKGAPEGTVGDALQGTDWRALSLAALLDAQTGLSRLAVGQAPEWPEWRSLLRASRGLRAAAEEAGGSGSVTPDAKPPSPAAPADGTGAPRGQEAKAHPAHQAGSAGGALPGPTPAEAPSSLLGGAGPVGASSAPPATPALPGVPVGTSSASPASPVPSAVPSPSEAPAGRAVCAGAPDPSPLFPKLPAPSDATAEAPARRLSRPGSRATSPITPQRLPRTSGRAAADRLEAAIGAAAASGGAVDEAVDAMAAALRGQGLVAHARPRKPWEGAGAAWQ